MSSYRVIIEGTTLPGFAPAEVAPRFATLARQKLDMAERLLSGHPRTVRSGVDQPTAIRYANALQEIGVACHVEIETVSPATEAPAAAGHAASSVNRPSGPTLPNAVPGDLKILPKGPGEKYCSECRAVIRIKAELCPECGVRQYSPSDSAPTETVGHVTTAPKSKKTSALIKVLGALLVLGVIGNLSSVFLKRSSPAESPLRKSEAAKTAADSKAAIDRCVASGQGMAIAYIANVRTALQVGLMASEVRDQGCAKSASEFKGVGSCLEDCKRGFKSGLNLALDAAK